MQALFVLAFAIGLATARARAPGGRRAGAHAVPLAALAVGSVYAYSFPGLLWLGGAAAGLGGRRAGLVAWRRRRLTARADLARRAVRPAALALRPSWSSRSRPELGRMVDFARFETFDPDGAGPGQPLQPDLAARGARHLALGRLPPRPRRRRRARRRLLARARALGLAALAFGLVVVAAPRRAGGAGRARRGRGCCSPTPRSPGRPTRRRRRSRSPRRWRCWSAPARWPWRAPTCPQAVRIVRRRGIAGLFPRSARVARARLGVGAWRSRSRSPPAARSLLALVNGPVGPARWSPALARAEAACRGRPWSWRPTASWRTSTAATSSSGSCAAGGCASRPTRGPAPGPAAARHRPGDRLRRRAPSRRSRAPTPGAASAPSPCGEFPSRRPGESGMPVRRRRRAARTPGAVASARRTPASRRTRRLRAPAR